MGGGVALTAARIAGLVLLAGCPKDLPTDQPCAEAAYAIAGRAEQCTGDAAIAAELYDALEADYTCVVEDFPLLDEDGDPGPQAYECALVTRNIACELAVAWGADVDAWLDSSPICGAILERR